MARSPLTKNTHHLAAVPWVSSDCRTCRDRTALDARSVVRLQSPGPGAEGHGPRNQVAEGAVWRKK